MKEDALDLKGTATVTTKRDRTLVIAIAAAPRKRNSIS